MKYPPYIYSIIKTDREMKNIKKSELGVFAGIIVILMAVLGPVLGLIVAGCGTVSALIVLTLMGEL